jgi:predicted phage terminase large subunit-like protein
MHQTLVTPNSSLSPQQAAQEILRRRRAAHSLTAFIEYLDLGFIPAAHHLLLIKKLEALERGDIPRLMVLMPPGSAKSTYTSILFPPYFMGRNPESAVLAVSNSTDLAERFSRRARNIVGSPRYRNVFHFNTSGDNQSAGNWDTELGGELFAAGVGSAIAGRRADLGLIDDPIRNREEADSERIREKQWDWYVNDFVTRLKPGARQILIQTRWHEDDLGGRILASEGSRWDVLKLPMEAGPNDALGRKEGERLWPEWFTPQMVLDAKTRDIRTWSALYQQEPAPDEGVYFKREWFQTYSQPPSELHVYGASDYAVSEGGGDYTEHGLFGLDFNGCLYVLDWWRAQAASNEWIEARKAIEPFLKKRMIERRTPCRLEWLPSINDKVTRARAMQAKASMSDVFLPKQAPWLADVMKQLLQFPAGKYDDAVDVFSLMGRGLDHVQAPAIRKADVQQYAAPQPQGWMS